MANGGTGRIQVLFFGVGAIQLLTASFSKELLTKISSRAGFSAQGYFHDTGIIFGAWVREQY